MAEHDPWIVVGGIAHRVEGEAGTQGHGLGPPQGQQGVARAGAHGGQAVDPRAPQQVGQDRLGLVVGGVAGGGPGAEDAQARLPRPRLEVGTVADLHPLGAEGRPEPGGGGGHHGRLGGRAGPEAVVHVDRGDLASRRHGQDQEGQ